MTRLEETTGGDRRGDHEAREDPAAETVDDRGQVGIGGAQRQTAQAQVLEDLLQLRRHLAGGAWPRSGREPFPR